VTPTQTLMVKMAVAEMLAEMFSKGVVAVVVV
jgi:hypothetical protein